MYIHGNRCQHRFLEYYFPATINQPAIRSLRVLRPLKLVTGIASKSCPPIYRPGPGYMQAHVLIIRAKVYCFNVCFGKGVFNPSNKSNQTNILRP